MVKKTITYTDYNGNIRTEDHYFNLNKAEILSLELNKEGGYGEYLNELLSTNNTKELFSVFEDFILTSYGVKSEDGKRFMKSDEIRESFRQSEAYSELLYDLITDSDKAAEFFSSVIPKEVSATAKGNE